MSNPKTKVAIACQGGGSHTAFTAGALIEIFSNYPTLKEKIDIIGFSGTSGGGICAALAWYGLNFADYNKSIEALEAFWEENKTRDIYQFCLPLFSFSPFIYNTTFINKGIVNTMRYIEANSVRFEYIPAWLKSESRNALETILNKMIDKNFIKFDEIEKFNEIKKKNKNKVMSSLHIGAVDINNGIFRAFKNEEITLEALLASTAVPPLFESVEVVEKDENGNEIDRSDFWDGLYSQNPPICNFLKLSELDKQDPEYKLKKLKEMKNNKDDKPDEIWIIRINPKEKGINKIKTPQQQKDRQNELAGNLSLQQECNSIDMVNDIRDLFEDTIGVYYKHIKIHEIEIDEICLKNNYNIELDYPSKLERTPFFIDSLIEHGKEKAKQHLNEMKLL